MLKLSEKQLQIVEASDKYVYVIAGAGSGKTRTLTERIRRLLSKSKPGERILAITFSNKAANELKERLLNSFSEEHLKENVFVGTIHSFCMDVVLQRGHVIGLPNDIHIFESPEDRLEIFKKALENCPRIQVKNQNEIKSLFDKLSEAKRNFKFPCNCSEKSEYQELYMEYNSLMITQNAIDYDDILLYAYRIFSESTSTASIYQRIYKHICVDEAQDLNKVQYSVIKAIAGNVASIFMVGDPNQAIYGFNSSSSSYMCKNFPEEFSAKQYSLTENYRSSMSIMRAAEIIEPSFKMNGTLPINGIFEMWEFKDERAESEWVAEKISRLLVEGHEDVEGTVISLKQCAVLARNKYALSSLTKVLEEHGIGFTLRMSNQGFSSESLFFRLFDLGLKVLMNKNDKVHFMEMMNLINETSENVITIEHIAYSDALKTALGAEGAKAICLAWEILTAGGTLRFNKALEIIRKYCELDDNFQNDDERSLIYHDYFSWEIRWKSYVDSSSIENRNLAHMLRSVALGITSNVKESGITLSTVHMAKGLEFDVIFIVGLCEGVFPDYRATTQIKQLEEQHNLFVSITRSKRLCYISYPKNRVMPWGDSKKQEKSRYMMRLSSEFQIFNSN